MFRNLYSPDEIPAVMEVDPRDGFRLDPHFLMQYRGRQPLWGPVGPDGRTASPIGLVTFLRTYPAALPDGSTETPAQVFARCVETVMATLRRQTLAVDGHWSDEKAQREGQEMFRRMWALKVLPGGRSLANLGRESLRVKGAVQLNNCSFWSTKDLAIDPVQAFASAMDYLMLGSGVGFDVEGAGTATIVRPVTDAHDTHRVVDTREGWVNALARVIAAYTGKATLPGEWDFTVIRPKGAPLRTFGGTSSGAGPLRELLATVVSILARRVDHPWDIPTIVDTMNCIGRCVVAGGVRRSSEIAIGPAGDAVFAGLKDPSEERELLAAQLAREAEIPAVLILDGGIAAVRAAQVGLSVLSPEWDALQNRVDILVAERRAALYADPAWSALDARINATPNRMWRWASNNSVSAAVGSDYTDIAGRIARNGEPGVLWRDNVRRFGRMADGDLTGPRTVHDGFIPGLRADPATGTNPCQPAEALVLTPVGIRTFANIEAGSIIWSGTQWTTVVRKVATGEKPVFRYRTSAGSFLGTEEHRVVSNGVKVPVREAEVIDTCVGPAHDPNPAPLDPQAIMDGLVLGDGGWHGASRRNFLHQGAGDDCYDTSEVAHLLGDRSVYGEKVLRRITTTLPPLPRTYEREVPARYLYGGDRLARGFLRGLYAANGSVCGGRVTLKAASRAVIDGVQAMLSAIGIRSFVTTNKAHPVTFANGEYTCRESYDLNIGNAQGRRDFARLIGFLHPDKADRLAAIPDSDRAPKVTFDVTEVEPLGTMPVYDITVDAAEHTYWTNGVLVSNCGEVALESGELCLAAGTRVLTRDGYRPIETLVGEPVEVVTHYRSDVDFARAPSVARATVFPTGTRPTLTLTTVDGRELTLTAGHPVLARREGVPTWVPAGELMPGDDLYAGSADPHALNTAASVDPVFYALGRFTGDGWFLEYPGGRFAIGTCAGAHEREHLEAVIPAWRTLQTEAHAFIETNYDNRTGDADPVLATAPNGVVSLSFSKPHMFRLLRDRYGFTPGTAPTKRLPGGYWTASRDCKRAFLRGLFDADGCVPQGARAAVTLTAANRDFARDVLLALEEFGITARITTHYIADRGRSQTILMVRGADHLRRFAEAIYFPAAIPSPKADALAVRLAGMTDTRASGRCTIRTIEPGPTTSVFNLEVPGARHYVAEGVVVHNCNLIETFPTRHDGVDDWIASLKYAYMIGKAVSCLPLHNAASAEVVNRNRRLGISITGIAGWYTKLGRAAMCAALDRGYRELRRIDRLYSGWLGVPESIRLTTVKPSGCRPWNALTTTSGGILTLEELLADHPDDTAWAPAPEGLDALQGPGAASRITKTYVNGEAEVFRVEMSYGLAVESTGNHPWFVREREDRSTTPRIARVDAWVPTEELRPGDILEVSLGTYTATAHAPLRPVNRLAVGMRGDATIIRQPTEMTPELAWFLGYLWGDGAMSPGRYRIRFTDGRRENIDRAAAIAWDLFGVEGTIFTHGNATELSIASKHLWCWLLRNDVWKYHADRIDLLPRVVRASAREDILAFLAGLLDADGSAIIANDLGKLIWTTADAAFASHVQHVAWSVGLGVGRSVQTHGSSYQAAKELHHITLGLHYDREALTTLAGYSTKAQDLQRDPRFTGWHGWAEGGTRRGLIVGKVKSVTSIGVMPTYDVEVADTHWFYAGAVKSHNTLSLVAGVEGGMRFPEAPHLARIIRFHDNSPLIARLAEAGYRVESDRYAPHTVCVYFPHADYAVGRAVTDVSVWEQAQLQADLQRWWSDNMVSATWSFTDAEAPHLHRVLSTFDGVLKGATAYPHRPGAYVQPPYQPITPEEHAALSARLRPLDLAALTGTSGARDSEEKFCDGGVCSIA